MASPTRELPPRARRIPPHMLGLEQALGTTSACAENTQSWGVRIGRWRNYLRVRGEYYSRASQAGLMMELPPRARRIRSFAPETTPLPGTTSACAENTIDALLTDTNGCELPPRARRIRCHAEGVVAAGGTTSACAENTPCTINRSCCTWNYLRVRGEYGSGAASPTGPMELPPRARRIR